MLSTGEKKLVSKLYIDMCIKVLLNQGQKISVKKKKKSYTRMLFVADSV